MTFALGEAADVSEARSLIERYRDSETVVATLDDVRRSWDAILGSVRVDTPDRSLDLLVDRWLP
ncbi:MAG: hypothetical protein IPF82_16315 [Blastocatellia bacterium]|nr:hypothetical protein [Blastocatellia bacterium]